MQSTQEIPDAGGDAPSAAPAPAKPEQKRERRGHNEESGDDAFYGRRKADNVGGES